MFKTFKKILKNRVLVTLFAVTMLWFSLATAFASKASTEDCLYQLEIWYYTDVSRTQQCGYTNACTGEWWGCLSQYRKTNAFICPCE
jgi:hypothetical protein